MTFWTGRHRGHARRRGRRINKAINDGLNSPAMQASLARFRVEPGPGSPQAFGAFIASTEEMGGRDPVCRHQDRE
jgi:hypothetical protein